MAKMHITMTFRVDSTEAQKALRLCTIRLYLFKRAIRRLEAAQVTVIGVEQDA